MVSDQRACPVCAAKLNKAADVCGNCGHQFRGGSPRSVSTGNSSRQTVSALANGAAFPRAPMTPDERNKILKLMGILGGAALLFVVPLILLAPKLPHRVVETEDAKSQSSEGALQQSASEPALATKIDPDAISSYTERDRKSYPKLFTRLGKRVFEVGEFGEKAALLTLKTGRCDRVSFVDVSEKSTREQLQFYVDCANETRVRVTEGDIRAGVAADFETKDQRDRMVAARAEQNEARVSEAQARVSQVLREPGSAVFGPTFVSQKGGVVCGAVNARNGFGGMSGNQPFIVFKDSVVMGGDSAFPRNWKQFCNG